MSETAPQPAKAPVNNPVVTILAVVIVVAPLLGAYLLIRWWVSSLFYTPPTPPLPASLVGKTVWTTDIDFDGRYGSRGVPDRASWGYHDKDNWTSFPSAQPCAVKAVNVGQDGTQNGSVYCLLTSDDGTWTEQPGWTSTFTTHAP